MLMANIDKGVQKMTSLEEKKGTMNSEYFGFMSRDQETKSNKGIYTTPIRCRLQGKMDALNASFDLLKSQLFQCPPPHSMQEQLITVYVKRGGGEEGVQSQILKKKNRSKYLFLKKIMPNS